MLEKKKILVFSVPFSGHLIPLKNMILKYKDQYDFKVLITSWTNIKCDIDKNAFDATILAKSELGPVGPGEWTFPRAAVLLDECVDVTKNFSPDLIIYDYFAIEAYFVGKILGITTWSSLPAMVGPHIKQADVEFFLSLEKNKEAIKIIEEKSHLKIDHVEMISDGLFIPASLNLIWSYKNITSPGFLKNRARATYAFTGNIRGESVKPTDGSRGTKPTIFFSLGTVVMGNLWNQDEIIRNKLKNFFSDLANIWKDKDWNIIFVTQGKKVLDTYPENWQVFDNVDQVKVLSESDVFVTHAGAGSVHEAILQKVPMVAIPFFGDHIVAAQRIEDLNLGINLVRGGGVEVDTPKDFSYETLAERIDAAVEKILVDTSFRDAYDSLKLESISIDELIDGKVDYKKGDVIP